MTLRIGASRVLSLSGRLRLPARPKTRPNRLPGGTVFDVATGPVPDVV